MKRSLREDLSTFQGLSAENISTRLPGRNSVPPPRPARSEAGGWDDDEAGRAGRIPRSKAVAIADELLE